jgi:hypothetical protein
MPATECGTWESGQRGEWRRCSSHGWSSRTQLTSATPHAKHTHRSCAGPSGACRKPAAARALGTYAALLESVELPHGS